MKLKVPFNYNKFNREVYLNHCYNIALIMASKLNSNMSEERVKAYLEITGAELQGEKDE